jgi:hypothetical protein
MEEAEEANVRAGRSLTSAASARLCFAMRRCDQPSHHHRAGLPFNAATPIDSHRATSHAAVLLGCIHVVSRHAQFLYVRVTVDVEAALEGIGQLRTMQALSLRIGTGPEADSIPSPLSLPPVRSFLVETPQDIGENHVQTARSEPREHRVVTNQWRGPLVRKSPQSHVMDVL